MRTMLADAYLRPISVCVVIEHFACKLTRQIAAATAAASAVT